MKERRMLSAHKADTNKTFWTVVSDSKAFDDVIILGTYDTMEEAVEHFSADCKEFIKRHRDKVWWKNVVYDLVYAISKA